MNNVDILLKVIPIGISIGAFLVGMVAGFAVAYYRLHQVELRLAMEIADRIKDFTELKASVDTRLFKNGGELRYRTATSCEDEQVACRNRMAAAISSLTEGMAKMEKRWEKVIIQLYQSGGGRRVPRLSEDDE